MKLKFKEDGVVSGEVVFKKGGTYEISNENGSATRWIKRGAEVVHEEIPNKPIVEESKEEFIEEVADEHKLEEEVVIAPSKKENRKEKKSSK